MSCEIFIGLGLNMENCGLSWRVADDLEIEFKGFSIYSFTFSLSLSHSLVNELIIIFDGDSVGLFSLFPLEYRCKQVSDFLLLGGLIELLFLSKWAYIYETQKLSHLAYFSPI